MKILKGITLFTLPLALLACGNDDLDPDAINAPDIYEFTSLTDPSAPSSVEYLEATTRLTLINELENLIESSELSELGENEGEAAVIERLNRVYEQGTKNEHPTNLANTNIYTDQNGATPIQNFDLPEELDLIQNDFSDLKADINLKDIMPGILQDLHYRNPVDSEKGLFIGWTITNFSNGDEVANQLIQQCFKGIAILLSDSDDTTDHIQMFGGTDYKAFAISFLKATITYHQLTAVHLDIQDLLTSNPGATQTESYTEIQHQWDLAFGYFGGRKNYLKHKSLPPYNDDNFDEKIDLSSEYNFYLANEARSRDNTPVPETNFSYDIIENFLLGRTVINNSFRESNNEWQEEIPYYTNRILVNIEKLMAANLIHHLNEIKYTAKFYLLGDDYKRNYFTAWSNSKGVALALQFNPNSTLSRDQLIEINDLIGGKPQTSSNSIANYLKDIDETITILRDTYNIGITTTNAW